MMKIVKGLSTFLAVLVLVSKVESQECNSPFTAYIVLDGSKSIGASNFDTVKNETKTFASQTINRNNGNKLGIVVYSDNVTNNITATSDITSLANRIDTIPYPEAGTATDKGILFARQQLQRVHTFNRRVMIVITDGNSNELNKTLEAAREAKDDGITIFAVGIDEEIKHLGALYENFEAELINIASYNTLVYRTGLFRDLSTPLFEVLQQLCQHVVSVVKPLNDLTLVEGSMAIFRVMLTDPEVTNVVWRRYGQEVNSTNGYLEQVEGRNHTLTKSNIRIEHSGEYSFTLGNVTSQCILTVIGRLQDITAKVGDEAYFRTFVSPAPVAGGKWFKGANRIFSSSSKYTITSRSTFRSLLVRNVTDSSNDTYTFTLNSVSTTGSLIVEGTIVDGGWSAWRELPRECPVTCGKDAMKPRTKVRNCTNPTPSFGGKLCDGRDLDIQLVNCSLEDCIVNGDWGAWAEWRSNCDNETCGDNYTTRAMRERDCDNPPPSINGAFCTGERFEIETILCQRVPCAVNGGFGQWSEWTTPACSVSCGGGSRMLSRQRRCDSPEPLNGGANCTGDFEEFKSEFCNPFPCSVNGGFGQWSEWTTPACSVSCGEGTRLLSRQRRCDSPEPAIGGTNCTGDFEEFKSEFCNRFPCSEDGGFGEWSTWTSTECSVSCGGGNRTLSRQRKCDSPEPSNGGANCTGDFEESKSEFCNPFPCSEDGGFGEWSTWTSTECSVSCGGGNRTLSRQRKCDSPEPNNGGANCTGDFEESKSEECNKFPCNGLCDDVTEKDGVGYRYHPSDCDKYVQCYSNLDGHVLASVKTCQAGFYWNQAKFKCQESRRVICPLESYSSSRMSMKKIPGSCRSYWLKEERSQARCCPLSFSFVEGKGCRLNKDCQDLCPQPFEHRCVCDKRPLSLSKSPFYQLFNSERGWVNASCPSGTVFDLTDCGCSDMARDICDSSYTLMFNVSALPDWMSGTGVTYTDGAANFSGSGMMTFDVNLGAKFNPIKIQFRYKETGETTGTKILLRSNCYDNDDDLAVHVDEEAINVRVKSGNKDVEEYTLPTLGIQRSDWKTVTLLYDGRRFGITVESGSVRYSGYLYVYGSDFAQCQMVFGSERGSTSTKAFSGSLSMISFSQCGSGLTA